MVGHHTLFVVDIDADFIPLNLNGVLVGGKFFGLGANLEAEMPFALPGQFQITPKLGAQLGVTLVEFGQPLFERAKRFLFLTVGLGNGFFDDGGMLAQFANQLCDDLFQGPRRDTAQRAMRVPPVAVDAAALVVEVLLAVGVLLAAGMRNQAVTAVAASGQALENSLMFVALAFAGRLNLTLVQSFVGLVPELGRNNPLVLAGILLPAMPDDAFVNGIGDDLLDLVGAETFPAPALFAVPRLVNALAGTASLVIDLLGNQRGVAELSRQRVDALDQNSFLPVGTELFRLRIVVVAERNSAACPHATLGAFGQLVGDALRRQLAFVLAETQQHVEHESPGRCPGIKALGGRNKIRAVIFQQLPEVEEIAHGAGNPIQLVGDNHINLAPLDRLNQPLHAGPFKVLPRITRVFKEVGFLPAFMLVNADQMAANIVLTFQRVVISARLVVSGDPRIHGATGIFLSGRNHA
ncbi:MAG: hypothetical protein Q7Q73_08455 [Verrucomicrobiota bacterium JB024]|nr:hypothetical protein [Verrucomicrobiota bacterium JB024]